MTTLDVNRLKYISKRSKYAVTHYIRSIQSSLPSTTNYYNIPEGIINICILFFGTIYQFDDEWKSQNLQLQNDTVSVKEDSHPAYNYIYSQNIMSSGQHQWTFKIIKIKTESNNHDFFFGIKEEGEDKQKIGWFSGKYTPTYYLMGIYPNKKKPKNTAAQIWSHTVKWDEYGKYLEDGDIVTMCIDLDKWQLKYIINDKDYGVAANIKIGSYRAVVMMYDLGDIIQLM